MDVVLDTNHFRELANNSTIGRRLERRLVDSAASVHLCIAGVEETLQGFLAMVRRRRAGRNQVAAYSSLDHGLAALQMFPILPFDSAAAEVFHRLQRERIRVGTMDLKIAAICLTRQATLLTRTWLTSRRFQDCR